MTPSGFVEDLYLSPFRGFVSALREVDDEVGIHHVCADDNGIVGLCHLRIPFATDYTDASRTD